MRKPRLFLPFQPLHMVVRGHSRRPIVRSRRDCQYFIECLKRSSMRYGVAIHAWVLMTNHLHLLLTPAQEHSLARMMQWLGRNYARYYNQCCGRSGALWEGRYKTSCIDTETYLLACYRYIELNPVRAAIVERPAQYPWSSYHQNGRGKPDGLVTPHAVYLALGDNPEERTNRYRGLFAEILSTNTINDFRLGVNKGRPVGSPEFLARMESMSKP